MIIERAQIAQPVLRSSGSVVFSIYLPEGEPWYSDKRRVVDTDRGIALQFTGGIGSEGMRGFLLSQGAMRFPVSTIERTVNSDRPGRERYFVYEIVSLVESFPARVTLKPPHIGSAAAMQ